MPYHISIGCALIEQGTSGAKFTRSVPFRMLDQDESWIEEHIARLRREGRDILFDGFMLSWDPVPPGDFSGTPGKYHITFIRITYTEESSEQIRRNRKFRSTTDEMIIKMGTDVTNKFITGPPGEGAEPRNVSRGNKGQTGKQGQVSSRETPDAPIFIVHGADTLRAQVVARAVEHATGREAVILHEQPNLGQTIIEKFEQHAAHTSYAVILLTPDDHGGRGNEPRTRPRARQNVIFEMGYFYGLIGRGKVSVLVHPAVERPSDTHGIVYITFDDDGSWKFELLRELRQAGFKIRI